MKALKSELRAVAERTRLLEAQLVDMTTERDYLERSMDAMHELNKELRAALSVDLSAAAKARRIAQDPFILAHTPHFLGYDRSGLESSHPKMSAYKNVGIF
jgi:hypothetical protein